MKQNFKHSICVVALSLAKQSNAKQIIYFQLQMKNDFKIQFNFVNFSFS